MATENLYIALKDLPRQPIRLGIQGPPGEGKTWSALTFPNVIIWDLDKKLSGYQAAHPESTVRVLQPTRNLVAEQLKISNRNAKMLPDDKDYPPNVRDAVKRWLEKYAPDTLGPNETLVLDSWSTLQNFFDFQSQLPWEMSFGRSGEEDKFAFWRLKQKYAGQITEALKLLNCHVIVTCHETIDRDDDGKPTGKLRPLMQGGFADQLAGQFTDWYRMKAIPKLNKKGEQNVVNGRKIEKEVEYYWQTQSDAMFTACCSIPGLPQYVPATFESLKIPPPTT